MKVPKKQPKGLRVVRPTAESPATVRAAFSKLAVADLAKLPHICVDARHRPHLSVLARQAKVDYVSFKHPRLDDPNKVVVLRLT